MPRGEWMPKIILDRLTLERTESENEIQRLKERLEQCEALLQRYLLNHEGNTCSCSICDAARAAVEGR